ncbi:MAG: UPF0182 family protein, partial [Candidatus Bathyarchaeia archaeon]
MRLLRERGVSEAVPREYYDFKIFRMPWMSFLLWQITKVLVGILLFRSVFFGMAVTGQLAGAGIELGSLSRLLPLPFVTPPFDPSYAQSEVIPLLPILTLVVTPILGALATRLALLVAFTQILRIFTPSVSEAEAGQVQLRWRLAVVESLICMGLLWAAATAFFPSFIDYNSKYAIVAYATLGGVFGFFALRDGGKRGRLLSPTRRSVLIRVMALIIIVLLFASVMAVNNSIADARKVEWRGPYTAQQIGVNRHLAELDNVKELPYNFSLPSLSRADIATYTQQHEQLLSKVRLWDWQAAFAKLKPEIGLIPYVDFQDSDILRFNDTLYWSASMKPVMPPTVRAEDQWYAEHLVYTHVPVGFLLLSGDKGQIEPTSTFFEQRRIYYGEGGLLSDTWAAFPLDRDISDEIDGYFYEGIGGIDIPPPLSWLFEFNFLLAYRDESVHVMRYRDIYEKMQVLFPYFEYEFNGKNVDMFPVTDGKNTYYLMPLIVALDTRNVPWSGGN